jgi:UDP-GlcNAc:undecaprenyl-phosphate GlcNAc-1-phosphate transferase
MSLLSYFYIFLVSLVVTLMMIPPISRLAIGMGILDRPDERKVHLSSTPRLGGIAIFFAFMLAIFMFGEIQRLERGFMAGGVIIFLLGLADDLTGLNPRQKLMGQTIAVLTAVLIGGVMITSLGNLFGTGEIGLGIFSLPFTLLTTVGVINAINLLDGLDGLAGGVSAIAAAVIGILAYQAGNGQITAMTIALLGSVLGFLRFNSYPASIFMGDAGSLFLGYAMGLFSVMMVTLSNGTISVAVPLLILAVPVLDTLYVIWRRLKEGKNLFQPDNNHIHHRFLDLGTGHRFTVILVYLLAYTTALLAVVFHSLPTYQLLGLLAISYPLIYLLLRELCSMVEKKRQQLIRSDLSFRDMRLYRRLVWVSHHLRTGVKYLILVALSLSLFIPSVSAIETVIICSFLIILSGALVFLTNDWGNRFLLFVLYFDGAFIIYLVENMGRYIHFSHFPLNLFSHLVFLVLFLIVGAEAVLRNRIGEMISSPIDYLIFFLIVSVPLMPNDFTRQYHLLTVAGKSIILFGAYKLILMRQARRNRKVIAATLLALLVAALKVL